MAVEAHEMYALFQGQTQGAFNPQANHPGWVPFKLPMPARLAVNAKSRFCPASGPVLAIQFPLSACRTTGMRSLVQKKMIVGNPAFSQVIFRLVRAGTGCNGKILDDLELRNVVIKTLSPWVAGAEMVIRLTFDAHQIAFNA